MSVKEMKLYQVDFDLDENGILFMPYETAKKHYPGISQLLEPYKVVYEYTEEVEDGSTDFKILEDLFVKFNIERPDDFSGRSLSVSDIVQLGDKFYYCDSFGWIEVS